MKQIAVLSGKGGTGKTVLTASLIALAENRIMVDCDVDAADLYILLNPAVKERYEFIGGEKAFIDNNKCQQCGICTDICRFKAISDDFIVDGIDCEGCGFCSRVCPEQAITMKENLSGEWFISDTVYGPLVHAKLGIAEENSGKLVTKIREAARNLAEKNKLDYLIIDGPPGVGCPVMATLTGVDLALIVTEPTVSGMHDMQRVLELTNHFNIPAKVIVNKYDINKENTEEIRRFSDSQNIEVIGMIPFSPLVSLSIVNCQPLVEFTHGALFDEISSIWEKVKSNFLVNSKR